ncbi:unnamed protein product, partial [Brassica oleracea var. botrytis]
KQFALKAQKLSDTRIEVRLQPPHLDVGEPSSRRRRAFFHSSVRLPLLLFFISTGFASSPIWFSAFVNLSAHASVSLRRKLVVVSRSSRLSLYGSSTTRPNIFWGVPQTVEFLAGYSRCSSSMSLSCYVYPYRDEYPSRSGVDACHPNGTAPHQPDPSPSPPPASPVLSPKLPFLHHASSVVLAISRQGHVSISIGLDLHVLKLGLVSPVVFNYYLSSLMIICQKNFGGVPEIFTEAVLHTSYLSCAKSLSVSSSSTFNSFSLEK